MVAVTTPLTAPVVRDRHHSMSLAPDWRALERLMNVHVPQLDPAPAMLLTVRAALLCAETAATQRPATEVTTAADVATEVVIVFCTDPV